MVLKDAIIKFNKSTIKAGDGTLKGKYPLYTCSPVVNKYLDDYLFDDEAIILGTGGNPVINYCNGKFSVSTDCLTMKATEKFSTKYLYYYLIGNIKKIESMFRGAGLKHLNKNELMKMQIDNIEKEKQSKIVRELDKIQQVIDIRKKQKKQLDELIKSQFVEMFGDPNLVNDNDKIELKSIMLNANNGMARRGNDSDGNIVLRLVELQRNYIDYSNVNKITLEENEKKKYLLSAGDILFARVNGNPDNVGRCAYFKSIGEDVYHNDHIIRVKFDLQRVNPIYLCVLLNDEYGKGEFKNKIKTSAGQYTISQNGIDKVKIFLPPIELQNQFADIVKQIDKQKFESVIKSKKEMEKIQKNIYYKWGK